MILHDPTRRCKRRRQERGEGEAVEAVRGGGGPGDWKASQKRRGGWQLKGEELSEKGRGEKEGSRGQCRWK